MIHMKSVAYLEMIMKKVLLAILLLFVVPVLAGDFTGHLRCFNPEEKTGWTDVDEIFLVQKGPDLWRGRMLVQTGLFKNYKWREILSFRGELGWAEVHGHKLEKGIFNQLEQIGMPVVMKLARPWDYEWGAPAGGLYGQLQAEGIVRTMLCSFSNDFEYEMKYGGGGWKPYREGILELLNEPSL